MKDIVQYITENYDMLGNSIEVGDMIEFQTGGLRLYGKIESVTDDERPKYVVKTYGFYGDPSLRTRVKEKYTVPVTSKSIFKVNLVQKEK